MQKFAQKWSLISLLEPVEVGFEFFWKDYPLHVTLASVFALDWETDDLISKLKNMLAALPAVETKVVDESRWGDEGQYHMMILEKNEEIIKLHNRIHKFLIDSGAVFNQPEFEGEGYIPHSTIQKHARLNPGDQVRINTLTILDMFPNGDGYQRRIGSTFSLLGAKPK
jgi:2'-5' RNA ligase